LDARLAAVATAQVPAEVAHLLPQKVAPPVPAQEETVEEEPQSKGGGFLTNSTEEPVAPEGEVTADGGPSVGSGQSAS
jgi:hypothetical protein